MNRPSPSSAESTQPHSQWTAQPGRHMMEGSIRNLMAETLFPLTALVTAGFLTRRLGPNGYGLLVLAVSVVLLIQWSLNAIFARATIKHVSEAADWRPIGTATANLQLMVGTGAMLAIWVLAILLGRLLGELDLAWYVGVMAVDIPLACLVQSHHHILTGLGRFGELGLLSAGRWTVRLLLIVGFVLVGWGIAGAILGMIGGTLREFLLARRVIRPVLFRWVSWMQWPLWDYALPLFVSSVCGAVFVRLDLLSLKALGGSATQAGLFGAVVSPIVLSTVSRVLSSGDVTHAVELSRNAMRATILLWPLAVLIGGSSQPLVVLIFGESFMDGAPLVRVLVGGAFGKPRLLVLVTSPLVAVAMVGHLFAVPRWGALGAAGVTCALSLVTAIVAAWLAVKECGVGFPTASLWRSLLAAGGMLGCVGLWPATGLWVLPQLAVC